jgi:mannose-6-phosphate isomerase
LPLDVLIERAGEGLLGPASSSAHGLRLPFLLKVLAVARPLSLQAHPDAAQARAGFERSRAAADGIYHDPHPKPELICALSPFTALCGFLSVDQIRERLAAVGLADWVPAGNDESRVLAELFGRWLGAASADRAGALAPALAAASRSASRDRACARVVALAELHPEVPGVLAPLFLHEIELSPGEALFLPPGVLHAYLEGVAVELMASSDNVLRGGMTTKPVHVDELLRILRFASGPPPVLRAQPRVPGEGVWRTQAEEFELSELRPGRDGNVAIGVRAGVEILWCAEGRLHIEPEVGTGLDVGSGESCLVPAAVGPYRVTGIGRAFRAGLPLASSRDPMAPGERRTGPALPAFEDAPARRRGAPCDS